MPKIVIIEKSGTVKTAAVKDIAENTLYKKAGFKSGEGFVLQHTWGTEDGIDQSIKLYGKKTGRAGQENKYDFPPPIDTKLFFGTCAVIAQVKNKDGEMVMTNLTVELWEKIYEKLFGGFENLAVTCKEDEYEEDELENVPKHKKTKDGYLKDGFVVDSDNEDVESGSNYEDESETSEVDEKEPDEEDDLIDALEDIGSELSEDSYDYSD
jgi:hypothetical protein